MSIAPAAAFPPSTRDDGTLEVRLVHPPGVSADVMMANLDRLRERLAAVPRSWVVAALVEGSGGGPRLDPRSVILVATGDLATLGETARRAVSFPYAGMVDVAVVAMPRR